MVPASQQLHHDVACSVCGCVCDDLTVGITDGRITHLENACSLAKPWFESLNDAKPNEARIEGTSASLDDAIWRACTILKNSRSPLIFGLSRSSTAGQRAAVQLAECIGANIDTTASVCHGPSIMAIQQVGESTCSLGEIRNRADLVIFWGANPAESHPRHFERYSVEPSGMFIRGGRRDRTVVVIDTKPTASSNLADIFLLVEPSGDFELIWELRQLIQSGDSVAADNCNRTPQREISRLADLMTSCRYGVVFFGLGLAQTGLGHANVEALLRLVAELNSHTRFTARRLRIPGDVTGADSVLCWQTGFPFAVNLARGYPRYNPGEYTANELLEREEVDACLLVGSESVTLLSQAARNFLGEIPTITLDYPHVDAPFIPHVGFVTSIYGVHAAGTIYRMDEIPIPLRKLCDSTYSTDASILLRIVKQLACYQPSPSQLFGRDMKIDQNR